MNIFSVYISLIFFLIAIFLYRKSHFSLLSTINMFLLLFLVIVFNLFYVISNYFTGQGITEAVLFHLRFGLEGAGFGEYKLLIIFSILSIFVLVMVYLWAFWNTYQNRTVKMFHVFGAIFFMFLSIFFNPAVPDLYKLYVVAAETNELPLISELTATFVDEVTSTIQEIVTSTNQEVLLPPMNFENLYKEPVLEKIGESKNLVFIYLEGLEQTYSNSTTFPNLTPGLDDLEKKSIFFTNLKQTYGANFTIAGVVASQCGIPPVNSSFGNAMSNMDTYLPSAFCLGDLLKKENYYLSYFGGSDLEFAGKGLFYKTHGFNEINGLQELLPKVKESSYKTGWGLYDDTMFDLSYNRFIELSQSQKKFAMFALTLDSHHPNGNASASCKNKIYGDGSNTMLDAVVCTDYLVTMFVNKIMNSPYGSNTTIVIASDHLGLPSKTSELLEKNFRSNRLMIIPPNLAESKEIKLLGSTLDTGSTILPFIGYQANIGLGRNLLSSDYSEIQEKFIQENIANWTKQLNNFWFFPKIVDFVQINALDKIINIGSRKFKLPILIELDKNLQTTLKFNFELSEKLSATTSIRQTDESPPFLLIGNCWSIQKIKEYSPDKGICLVAGKGVEYTIKAISGKYNLTAEEIRRLTNF